MTATELIACLQAHIVLMYNAADGVRQEAVDTDNSHGVGFAEGVVAAVGEIDRLLTTLKSFTHAERLDVVRELDLAPGGK